MKTTIKPLSTRCTVHPRNKWKDEKPKDGRIRTHCGICGTFIGYRPAR